MPLGPLGVTAVLAALDWGAWDWATNSNHTTVVLIALARAGLQRLGAGRAVTPVSAIATVAADAPFDIEAQTKRIAA
jgi:hypothetical protein